VGKVNLTRKETNDDGLLSFLVKIFKNSKKGISNHLSEVIIILGFFIIALGSAIQKFDSNWLIDDFSEGQWLFEGGKILIGAGVFAVLLKSKQFSAVFRQHIYQVIFNPQNYATRENLTTHWVNFSSYLLKDILPQRYHGAAKRIREQFFDEELEYHFEDYCITYDITTSSSNMVSVNHTSAGKIIISPHAESPEIKQYIKVLSENNELKLKSFIIDDTPVPEGEWNFIPDNDDPKTQVFCYPIGRKQPNLQNQDLTHSIERTYYFKQNLLDEPYFLTNIERYVKGFKVRAKVPNSYKVIFKQFGVGSNKEIKPYTDGSGYTTWVLTNGKDLLLPGQGFILMVTKGE